MKTAPFPLAAAAALALLAARPGIARAAFEATAEDPVSAGLAAAGPAWPLTGRPLLDGPLVFGPRPAPGLAVITTRMEAAPELRRQGVCAWVRARGGLLVLRVRRLALAGYAETQVGLEVGRPAPGTGWGWALTAGRDSWSADLPAPVGEGSWRLAGAFGFAPRPGLRVGGRLTPGGTPGAALELGATLDPAPGWRAGLGSEPARNGLFGRMKVGLECRPGGGLALRAGMVPADGGVTVGLGLRRGVVALDVARREDPLLGVVGSFGFSVSAGAGGGQ